jgi:hypothetical protein
MKKRFLITGLIAAMVVYISSCYNNKEDILALPKVSLTKEIMPIMISGGCGCHNTTGATVRAELFSKNDTLYYDKILARVQTHFKPWVNGGAHPGGGAIDFSASEKILVKKWIDQGAPDDRGGCVVTGPLTYTLNILPEYTNTCKGGVCHGGVAAALDYNKMIAKKSVLETMMNSGGNSGHPGGQLSLSSCLTKKFIEWIKQGQPL